MGIETIIAIAAIAVSAGAGAESAHQSHVAANSQKNAEHKQENMLAQQQQEIKDEGVKNEAAQASAVGLARQRAVAGLQGPSTYGGTLGSGAGNKNSGPYGGAQLLGV